MKIFIKYCFILSLFLIINGCDKPAPTELVQEEEELEVEVLTKDTNDEYYTADSSGVVDDLKRHANVISISGIKRTRGDETSYSAYAQAIFFDRDNPVRRGNGKLLGYKTRILGDVLFNNVPARINLYNLRFKEGNDLQEVNLGFRHVLNSYFPDQDFNYQYNSSVNFQLDLAPIFGGNSINFVIPTPSEITGSIKFEGKREAGTLRAVLNWNGESHSKFEIILGAQIKNSQRFFPLFRIRTRDDGELVIPSHLINRIPAEFDNVVIGFVRKLEQRVQNRNGELYILSQSIHNLVLDIP
jgi:hypothetical protein